MATHQQQIWLEEYLQCWNATEAARRAQYAHPEIAGHRNKETFADEIARRLSANHMSAEEALKILADQARADLGPWMNDEGEVDIGAMKRDGMSHLIHTVDRYVQSGTNQNGTEWENVRTKVRTHDAQAALKLIMQNLGLLTEKVEHSGKTEVLVKFENDDTDGNTAESE